MPLHQRLPVILLATVICCPAGIVLLWQSKRRPAALAILLLGLAIVGALGWALRSKGSAPEAEPDEPEMAHQDRANLTIKPAPDEARTTGPEAEKAIKAQKHADDLQSFRRRTAAERDGALRHACPPGNCDRRLMWIIVEAAATDIERTQLTAMAEAALKADDHATDAQSEIQNAKDRVHFAENLDQQLLNRGLNPDAVTAGGQANKTLRIHAFFCSRQFAHDFDAGPARAAGFIRLECNNGLETITMDL